MNRLLWLVEHADQVLLGLAVWTAVSVVVALIAGPAIRHADERDSRRQGLS